MNNPSQVVNAEEKVTVMTQRVINRISAVIKIALSLVLSLKLIQ
jgi:hypothetical protein